MVVLSIDTVQLKAYVMAHLYFLPYEVVDI